ncbi:UDP-N-acetylglucosamine--N-acetylmuramyl-(pentapeptide) pyrophosphoryl-undecaprenol N-acetylglucosamine transferase, partial [Schumannella luteola]
MTVYLMAGGGTAGHVNPLLATADRLRERDPDAEVLVLGTAEGLEARLVPQRGYELVTVPRLPFPRRPNGDALRFPGRWRESVERTRGILRDRGVEAVVGFGGYAAAPAYAAAHREGLPLVIHEANARPGIANRYGARFTRHVATVFAGTRLRHARVVGLPLWREIETLDRFAARPDAADEFGLVPGRPTLLVTGGSLGARRLNEGVSQSVATILGAGWQVLHIT